MEVKIDTKEKFTVLTIDTPHFSDNIAAQLNQSVQNYLQTDLKNIVLKLPGVVSIDRSAAEELAKMQHQFYENHASFVICELTEELEAKLDELEVLEILNIAPTESEAWDIVQMEEIERELLDDEHVEFNSHGED